ncbi:MAG: insulinase family protein [Candidatus Obscuribacterales bacterium]|jgi:zinc protease|nr:insulinase family protein [Candidatus Obscuribacterales bacterium]
MSATTTVSSRIEKVQEAHGIVEYKLDNGLKILLAENHSAPVVTFMALFRVGSRNEAVGFTGATHFLEHMMFKGTAENNAQNGTGIDEVMRPLGALMNATTWLDRTNYFECVPSEHLETCIRLEADRMRNLQLRQEDHDSEMTVVRQEMEQGEDNPSRVLMKEIFAVAFREHPYHHPTIGWRSDVEGVPLARLQQFYDDFYWPNNATVFVAGDFDPANALALIEKYYGVYPSSPKPIPTVYTTEPEQQGERRFELHRKGDAQHIWMAYRVPEAAHPDTYTLAVIDAILTGGSSSRLNKALVEKQIAVGTGSWHARLRDPGLFIVMGTAAPGVELSSVESGLVAELERLAKEPVSAADLARVKNSIRKQATLKGTDPFEFCSELAEGEAAHDWRWFVEFNDNVDKVTAEDIQRVAAKYFAKTNVTVGMFYPLADEPAAAEAPKAAVAAEPKADETPAPAAAPKRAGIADRIVSRKLANGLTVQYLPNRGTGTVAVNIKVRAGSAYAPADKPLVPSLVASLLGDGSTKMDKDAIQQVGENMGVGGITFSADTFEVGTRDEVVVADFAELVAIYSDVLRNPAFPAEHFATKIVGYTSMCERNSNKNDAVARQALTQALYPSSHPYGTVSYADMKDSLKSVTVDDLKAFHAAHYTPDGAVLTIVGDVDEAAAFAVAEAAFGDWTGPAAKAIGAEAVSAIAGGKRIDIDMPGRATVMVMLGIPVDIKTGTPEFYAAQVANKALGGSTLGTRLGNEVREKRGLTYGITSSFRELRFGAGTWRIGLSTPAVKVEEALKVIGDTVAAYRESGITERELKNEASGMVGEFVLQLRTSAGLAQVIGNYGFMGMDLSDIDTYAERVKAVTKADADAMIAKYFSLDNAVVVACGSLVKAK